VRGRIEVLRAGGARSLVLDLRRAVGGQLADGVALADLFLDAGRKIAASRGREHSATANFVDSTASPFDSIPLAVLVDAGTAGAGEVVAGALQDNDRAAVLGAITFGRGVTQSTFALADGASVRLTTALWMTPRGRQIQRPPNPADGGPTDGSPADGRSVAGNPVPRPKFRSAGGRVLLGGGGIVPDRLVTDTGLADLTLGGARSLLGKAATTRGILALVTDR
jgi:carboxyl-terminal processing protease